MDCSAIYYTLFPKSFSGFPVRQLLKEKIKRDILNIEKHGKGVCQMKEHHPKSAPIPGLGQRSIKTALVATLLVLIYAFIPNHNPTFACIGAIFGMGADMQDSKQSGGNRFVGTVIGGVVGILLFEIEHLIFPEGNYWIRLPLVFVGIILMISVCVLFHWPKGVQPGGVVLFIILFNTPAHQLDYAIWRIVDTGVGVAMALAVNAFFTRERVERWFRWYYKNKASSAEEVIEGYDDKK